MSIFSIARLLLILGVIFVLVGGTLLLLARIGLLFGRLPGDIYFRRENFSCLIPIATSILVSILLTVVLNIVIRFFNR